MSWGLGSLTCKMGMNNLGLKIMEGGDSLGKGPDAVAGSRRTLRGWKVQRLLDSRCCRDTQPLGKTAPSGVQWGIRGVDSKGVLTGIQNL